MGENPLMGSIGIFAGNFAPRYWSFCDGQLLPISSHTALFSIIGTTYGGDGRTTFALPDLRGRTPIGVGQGPGLSNRALGQRAGMEHISLTQAQLPVHNHYVIGSSIPVDTSGLTATVSGTATAKIGVNSNGDTDNPSGAFPATNPNGDSTYATAGDGNFMAPANVDTSALGATLNGTATVDPSHIQLSNTGASSPVNLMQPSLGLYYCICMQGIFPSRG